MLFISFPSSIGYHCQLQPRHNDFQWRKSASPGDAGELTQSQGRMLPQHHLQPRRSTMSQSSTLCIGLDVHTDMSAVAYVAQEHGADVTVLGPMGTRQTVVEWAAASIRHAFWAQVYS